MKKRVSFRLFFTVVWRGICQVFRFIGKLFGYTDNCTYSKVLWHISATCMTVLLCLFTICLVSAFVIEVVIPKWINLYFCEDLWFDKNISNHVVFQKGYDGRDSRIYDLTKKEVLLDDVDWVSFLRIMIVLLYSRKTVSVGILTVLPVKYPLNLFIQGHGCSQKDWRL